MGEMLDAFQRIYLEQNGHCQNCGKAIPLPTPTNFAHKRSKNLLTKAEKLTEILLVCEDLHRYEHTRGNNLRSSNSCVKLFLKKYGEDFRNGYRQL